MTGSYETGSKYIKNAGEKDVFRAVAGLFLFSLFVMPQYFGIPLPVFDLTILRILTVLLTLLILCSDSRKHDFITMVKEARFTLILLPYLVVITYTMILRADINAFLNPFIELYCFYLLIYIFKYSLGFHNSFRCILAFCYLLAILGIVEYAIGRSPFSYLETIKGIYTGQFIRSGHYRIMSSCVHSLGYGLLIVSVVPFSCIDLQNDRIDIFKRPFLLLLWCANVFFTGSRSTLGVVLLELVILFFVSCKESKRKNTLMMAAALILFIVFLMIFHNTDFGRYIMLQITTLADEVLGTSYAAHYGASKEALGSSANYREQLKYIFTLDWLNPLLGIGRKRSFSSELNGSFIVSVDNFYIAEYIRYAYPGLAAFVLYISYFIVGLVKKSIRRQDAIYKVLLIGCLCYLINLFWVDSLQTLKYLYVLLALYCSLDFETRKKRSNVNVSKYMKR